jgi:chemotaxis protein CheZ
LENSKLKAEARAYSRQEVVEIIRSVLSRIDKDKEPTARLHSELTELAACINNLHQELSQLRSGESKKGDIPAAADELDAVVEETAKATGTIMDSCEKIERASETLEAGIRDTFVNAVTAIYEACGFQDITGQRITKVVKALKHIESRISAVTGESAGAGPAVVTGGEASLLNRPQLKHSASSQEDIDKLLSSFDK